MRKSFELEMPEKRSSWVWTVFVTLVLFVLAGAVLFPVYGGSRPISLGTNCVSNIKQLALGVIMYSNDYDDRLPQSAVWMDSVAHFIKDDRVYHDPEGVAEGEYGYAFRTRAGGQKMAAIKEPPKFILIFDSSLLGRNATSEPSTMPSPGRHHGNDVVGYLDGHAKALPML